MKEPNVGLYDRFFTRTNLTYANQALNSSFSTLTNRRHFVPFGPSEYCTVWRMRETVLSMELYKATFLICFSFYFLRFSPSAPRTYVAVVIIVVVIIIIAAIIIIIIVDPVIIIIL